MSSLTCYVIRGSSYLRFSNCVKCGYSCENLKAQVLQWPRWDLNPGSPSPGPGTHSLLPCGLDPGHPPAEWVPSPADSGASAPSPRPGCLEAAGHGAMGTRWRRRCLGEGDFAGRRGFFEGGFERLRRVFKCYGGLQKARGILDQGATVQYDITSPPGPSTHDCPPRKSSCNIAAGPPSLQSLPVTVPHPCPFPPGCSGLFSGASLLELDVGSGFLLRTQFMATCRSLCFNEVAKVG